MKNKLLLFGLFFALLQATVYGKRKKPDPPIIDEPLKINVDAGKERDSCMSLAKTIEEKQSLIDDALERMSAKIEALALTLDLFFENFRMSAKIEALEERMTAEAKVAEDRCTQRMTAEAKTTEERWTQRMTAEAKATEDRMTAEAKAAEDRCTQRMTAEANATEERWTQRMAAETKATEDRWNQRMTAEAKATEERWNQRFAEAIKTTEGSSNVATPHKRPAELACEKITNDLRSIGETTLNDIPYSFIWPYKIEYECNWCYGALIDKRFLITTADCVLPNLYLRVEADSVRNEIKAIHVHPDFSSETPSLNNIALIELESDVSYTPEQYPLCLYASQVYAESDLMELYGNIQIVADGECFDKTGTHLKPSQLCVKNLKFKDTSLGMQIYNVQENFPTHKLFAIVAKESDDFEPYVITKVFDHLDFIESIVWPKSGN